MNQRPNGQPSPFDPTAEPASRFRGSTRISHLWRSASSRYRRPAFYRRFRHLTTATPAASAAAAAAGPAQPRLGAHSPQGWVLSVRHLSALAALATPQAPGTPTRRALLQGTGDSPGEMPRKYIWLARIRCCWSDLRLK